MIWSSGHCKAGPPPGRNEFCRLFRQNKKAGFIVASRNRLVPTKGRLLAKNPHYTSDHLSFIHLINGPIPKLRCITFPVDARHIVLARIALQKR
jgi:hypothetical protein